MPGILNGVIDLVSFTAYGLLRRCDWLQLTTAVILGVVRDKS